MGVLIFKQPEASGGYLKPWAGEGIDFQKLSGILTTVRVYNIM